MLTREEYIKRYAEAAIRANLFGPVYPSIALAQGILESNNGNSTLTVMAKNHHGIKAGTSWKGKTFNIDTREVIAGNDVMQNANFRAYESDYASYKDHAAILEHPNFVSAGVTVAKTVEEQIAAIKAAGYATDPNYVQNIISIIDSNGLRRLDKKKRFINWLLQQPDLSCF